ncbi:Ig-like domain-containing protein, partial [Brucella suis]
MQKYWSWLLGVGLVVIAGGLAFYWNSLTRTADAPKVDNASIASPVTPGPAKEKPAQAQQTPATAMPATAKAVDVPVFDVLRVEADGSVVIAGQAAPNSAVDVVAGAEVVGQARAGANGDFAVVLDRALSPGDHQLVLRATSSDKHVATSAQTAIVSVPATADGPVLALVEEPEQASRLITKPKTAPEGSAAGAPSGGE